MDKLRAIIIDDEEDAVKSIQLIIEEFCTDIEIVGTSTSAYDGELLIEEKKPDIVFLDIEMPFENGFSLLKKLSYKDFNLIFITSYNEYAVEAFKYNAIDYLLKPIDIEMLIDVTEKVKSLRKKHKQLSNTYEIFLENIKSNFSKKLAIPTIEGMEYLNVKDIVRIEAAGSYSNIFINNGDKIVISKNLKELEDLLSPNIFFRVHNSHIINLEYVKKFIRNDGGQIKMLDGSLLPISRKKKETFQKIMVKFID